MPVLRKPAERDLAQQFNRLASPDIWVRREKEVGQIPSRGSFWKSSDYLRYSRDRSSVLELKLRKQLLALRPNREDLFLLNPTRSHRGTIRGSTGGFSGDLVGREAGIFRDELLSPFERFLFG